MCVKQNVLKWIKNQSCREGKERPGGEADHWPQCSAEIKNAWRPCHDSSHYLPACHCRDAGSIQATFVAEKMAPEDVFFNRTLRCYSSITDAIHLTEANDSVVNCMWKIIFWTYTSTPRCAFISCCLIKYRDKNTLHRLLVVEKRCWGKYLNLRGWE
jgi:hypothetical protein